MIWYFSTLRDDERCGFLIFKILKEEEPVMREQIMKNYKMFFVRLAKKSTRFSAHAKKALIVTSSWYGRSSNWSMLFPMGGTFEVAELHRFGCLGWSRILFNLAFIWKRSTEEHKFDYDKKTFTIRVHKHTAILALELVTDVSICEGGSLSRLLFTEKPRWLQTKVESHNESVDHWITFWAETQTKT